MPTPYDILGVSPDATKHQIGNAYRALLREKHLALNWNEIETAYETLIDDDKRVLYDIEQLKEKLQQFIELEQAAKDKVELLSQRCETLRISVYDANEAMMKDAYRTRMLETHPDKGGDPAEFRAVRDDYDYLMNEESPMASQTALSSIQKDLQAVKYSLADAEKKLARKEEKKKGGSQKKSSQKKKKMKAGTSFPILPMCLSSLSFKLCILTAVIIVIQTSYTYSRHCRSSEEERWFSYEE